MKESNRLIKNTKKKFFIYSFFGVALISIVSYLGLNLHVQSVKRQSSIQKMYTMINRQITLVSEISLLSERFDEQLTSSDFNRLAQEFRVVLEKLDRESSEFHRWLTQNDFSAVQNIEGALKDNQVESKMSLFLSRARKLTDVDSMNQVKMRKYIRLLTQSSQQGLGEVLRFIQSKIKKEQEESLSVLGRAGFMLVGLCLLQVVLVWLLVFKPLYSAILTQHRKLSEAALKAESASRSKTDFLANISHEIRTPMTAILGYADMLNRDSVSSDEKEDAIKVINQNASHLLGLIDEILDLSKIEAGKFTFKKEWTHLSSLLNEVYSLLNVKAEEKGIDLIFKNQGRIPQEIATDPKRLKQVLFNVLGNAIKFTKQGSVELIVSFQEKKQKLSFVVKDTGIGMTLSQKKKLFRPFEQADTSVARKYGGTGLGLVLSKGIAQGMGGDVRILRTRPGVGTEIEIVIDTKNSPEDQWLSSFSTHVVEEENSQVRGDELKGSRILVVDDAKENARLFSLYLQEAGAEVEVAHNGDVAIDSVKSRFFDLVLLDLQMPGKDGFQVIRELRKQEFDRPVVALTAHAMQEEKEKTRDAGFNDHITKPVKPDFLIRSVARWI